VAEIGHQPTFDFVGLDRALDALGRLDPQQAQVVELRFFGGLTIEETAQVLGISPATVTRDWRMAKVWLRREMERGGERGGERAGERGGTE
jgi:DNA-directed RNA polymerase specialized sigma24 family protein